MKKIENPKEYRECYATDKMRSDALKQALDIRKFEIDLYWKRTAYFWTLIAATFAGYITINKSSTDAVVLLLVSSIGICFSIGWYFVNRGSKYWQGNWERHVDILEDEFQGPLYKMTPTLSEFRFFKLNSAYPFSVSRVNQILSLFIVAIWLALFSSALTRCQWLPFMDNMLPWVLSIISIVCIFSLFVFGKTKKSVEIKTVSFEKREYKEH